MSSSFVPSAPSLAPNLSPASLWSAYLTYLVRYSSNSWVARIASFFRILAFLIIVPLIFLASLDIVSYVIARTLGVVDDSKASTSDNATIHSTGRQIRSEEELPRIIISSDTLTPVSKTYPLETQDDPSEKPTFSSDGMPKAYFAADEIGLSGAGIFSPAASRPSSPTLSRRQLRDDSDNGSRSSVFTISPTLSRSPSPTLTRKQGNRLNSKPAGSSALSDSNESGDIRHRRV